MLPSSDCQVGYSTASLQNQKSLISVELVRMFIDRKDYILPVDMSFFLVKVCNTAFELRVEASPVGSAQSSELILLRRFSCTVRGSEE